MKLLIVVEKTRTGFSAYSPDLEGCVATGNTKKRVEAAMQRALRMHMRALRSDGIKVRAPRSYSMVMEVPA